MTFLLPYEWPVFNQDIMFCHELNQGKTEQQITEYIYIYMLRLFLTC